jgi:pimeloyl-ACP methyl ester carboxylesterase
LIEAVTTTVELSDAAVTTTCWGDGPPDIVLLHDGLGSIAQWRSVPEQVARRSGRTVLAYDRPGHGASTPTPFGPWPADWLRTEARRLAELLDVTDAAAPLLVGHSDGGSIVLLHAAAGGAGRAALALAAHSWVEPAAVAQIERLRGQSAVVIAGLARHHAEPAALFEAWSGAWVGASFAPFDIRPELDTITMPTVVIQGREDEFATDSQAELTAAAVGSAGSCRLLPGVHHLMHHHEPELVVELVLEAATL